MKVIAKIIVFSWCMANLHAELLIIKRVQHQAAFSSNRSSFAQPNFAPLDETDKPNYPAIARVLLNYQWPMVIANPNLTSAEQDELLTADIPYAEENFIRRKLQEINPAYDVAFIPTCLYELFVFKQSFNALNRIFNSHYIITPEKRVLEHLNNLRDMLTGSPLDIAIKKFNKNISITSSNIYQDYNRANNNFYHDAFLYSNNLLATTLFNQYPTLKTTSNSFYLSRAIQEKSYHFAAWLIKTGITLTVAQILASAPFGSSYGKSYIDVNQELSLQDTTSIDQNKILAQVIKLEYQARQKNKALLLRGSYKTELIREKKEHNIPILGSTILENKLHVAQDDKSRKALSNNFLKSYKEKSTTPYSISFGNSLFSGYANDIGACAYLYLNRCNGYGLFINKKDQIEHQSNNLFFISPLASIVALFAIGEMFHSRAKSAIKKSGYVQGLTNLSLDSNPGNTDTLIINRNSLIHAQLFSQYLADNMVIITTPGHQASDLSPAEQAIYDQKRMEESNHLRANQRKAADYYGAIKKLGDHLPVATRNYRQKLDDEKVLNNEIEQIEEKYGQISLETELS